MNMGDPGPARRRATATGARRCSRLWLVVNLPWRAGQMLDFSGGQVVFGDTSTRD